jgi:hypothetical protein
MADISSNGTILASKNIIGVTQLFAGAWCVQVDPRFDATKVAPVATPDWANSPDGALFTYVSSQSTCTSEGVVNAVLILTGTTDNGSWQNTNEGFVLVIP